MTVLEISLEFDLLYNNILSNAAPGLSEYEKSVLLTLAQEQFVLGIYNGTLTDSFESTEQAKSFLDILVTDITLGPEVDSHGDRINGTILNNQYDRLYKLPFDCMFIVFEQLNLAETIDCGRTVVDVTPSTHDFLLRDLKNPFKGPSLHRAIRVSLQLPNDTQASYSEVLSNNVLKSYHIRYVRRPRPIILEDLYSYGLTIDGLTAKSDYNYGILEHLACELNPVTHRLILDLAVKKAVLLFNSAKLE